MRTESIAEIESRLIDLEVKASFAEDLIDKLNDVIVRQQDQLDRLLQEVTSLRQQAASAAPATLRSLRDELPPHY
jgi:SlyX protein